MNTNKLIAAVAVAGSAIFAMPANAATFTTNDVTWTYTINPQNSQCYLGTGTDGSPAMPTDTALDASMIPWTFTDESGITHVSDVIGSYAFKNCTGLTGKLLIPAYISYIGNYCFNNSGIECAIVEATRSSGDLTGAKVFLDCSNLKGVWFKGQGNINMYHQFENATALKLVVFGPKIAKKNSSGQSAFGGVSGCKIFYSASQTSWSSSSNVPGWNNNKVIAYGAGRDFDMQFSDTENVVTFVPTTANALTNSLAWAKDFKDNLGLDTHINVTNTLDLTGVTITEQMVSNVTFDRLMFAVNTQAQLTAILTAFPATTPISIDPTGLTENMVIPDGYTNVFVKAVPGVTIKRTARGFIMIVR